MLSSRALIFFYKLCVCAVCTCSCREMHMKTSSWHQCSPILLHAWKTSILPTLLHLTSYFWDSIFHWIYKELQESNCFLPCSTRATGTHYYTWLLFGAADLNPDPHAYTVSTLLSHLPFFSLYILESNCMLLTMEENSQSSLNDTIVTCPILIFYMPTN